MEPQNTLAANALEWCKSIGSEAQTVQEAIGDPAVAKAVQVGKLFLDLGTNANLRIFMNEIEDICSY